MNLSFNFCGFTPLEGSCQATATEWFCAILDFCILPLGLKVHSVILDFASSGMKPCPFLYHTFEMN